MRHKQVGLPALAISLVIAIGLFEGSLSCQKQTEPITIGLLSAAPAFTPIYIAQSQDFFTMNGLSVTVKEYGSGQAAVQGMLSGEIDVAGSSDYAIVGSAMRKDESAVFAAMDKNQAFYLTGREDQGIEDISSPKLVIQFLKALAQADDYITSPPAEAKATMQRLANYDDAFAEENWGEHQFSLSLDQSLITAMEDEARWMIANNLTTGKQTPDFLDYIYVDGLKAVKPEAVNIIR